ncbi:hypothetical protein ACLI4R_01040 [Natrialbaceae archaeon A-chndr2]
MYGMAARVDRGYYEITDSGTAYLEADFLDGSLPHIDLLAPGADHVERNPTLAVFLGGLALEVGTH